MFNRNSDFMKTVTVFAIYTVVIALCTIVVVTWWTR